MPHLEAQLSEAQVKALLPDPSSKKWGVNTDLELAWNLKGDIGRHVQLYVDANDLQDGYAASLEITLDIFTGERVGYAKLVVIKPNQEHALFEATGAIANEDFDRFRAVTLASETDAEATRPPRPSLR